MKYFQVLVIVLFILFFTSCDFYSGKKTEDSEQATSFEIVKDSLFIESDTYKHSAKLVGEIHLVAERKVERAILSIEIYPTVLSDKKRMRYLRSDSVKKRKDKRSSKKGKGERDTLEFELAEPKTIDIDFDNPIRNLEITFEEKTSVYELQLFEGIRIEDQTREMHIPKKGLVIKF